MLSGKSNSWKPRTLISSWKGRIGARNQRFRLGYKGRLFDMDHDPGQRIDVSKKFPAVARELKSTVENFRNEVLPELGKDERPFVIGHPEVSWTQVPARDGVPQGGIKRRTSFPTAAILRTGPRKTIIFLGRSRSARREPMRSSFGTLARRRTLVRWSNFPFSVSRSGRRSRMLMTRRCVG